MRTGNQTDGVFEALRGVPPELSLERIEQLVTTLPPMPLWKSWLHYINLNSILMSAIAISFVVASLLLPVNVEQDIQTSIPAATPVETISVSSNTNTIGKLEPERQEVAIFTIADKVEKDEPLSALPPLINDTNTEQRIKVEALSSPPSLKFLQFPKTPPSFITELELDVDRCAPIPHQNSREIRQFKRLLLQSLHQDHLIHSTKQNVLVEIPGDEIRVNGQTLDKALLSKYTEFLYPSIPPCQGRYLVISRQFFGAGSYTKDGNFKGLSINPEQMPSLRKFKASLFPNSDVSTRMISDQTLLNSSEDAEALRKVLMVEEEQCTIATSETFRVLEWQKVRRLKRKLFAKLLKDKLITKEYKQAIIGLHEDKVMINGKAIEESLGASYRELTAMGFGIESGPMREVHLSPKFIIIGNFGDYGEMLSGQSHGRNMIVGKTVPSGLYADKAFRLRHDVKRWE